jgi:hypothetical protein
VKTHPNQIVDYETVTSCGPPISISFHSSTTSDGPTTSNPFHPLIDSRQVFS